MGVICFGWFFGSLMIPKGKDAFALFPQRKHDNISSAELSKMIFKRNGSKSEVLSQTNINDFVHAVGNGTDQIKISKLIQFIASGALSARGNQQELVPRVARVVRAPTS